MARKVGVYTRISRDEEGEALGVARQQQDCERLADLRSWQVVKTYEDNDVSAFKRNVVRDEFELMLTDLRAGLIDGIVAYDLDRLARQPRDLERLIDLFRRWQRDGIWGKLVTQLQAQADAKGLITWDVNVDSTICRAHQHAAGASKKGICKRSRPAVSPSSQPTTASDAPGAG
ncbi:recombinase family protein [Streptomyces avermitilis]|uniref:recombinase family protein n=1 Tax=Streptomyces avermitilis TaxID=33903 RepID=UPI003F4CFB11